MWVLVYHTRKGEEEVMLVPKPPRLRTKIRMATICSGGPSWLKTFNVTHPKISRLGGMQALHRFLEKHRACNADVPNIGSLSGGLWKVPKAERKTFFNLFCEAAKSFDATRHTAFVFRPPHTVKQPFLLDIDFKFKTEVEHRLEPYVELAEIVAAELQRRLKQHVTFAVVSKPSGYWKKVGGEYVYATGAHLYFPNVRLDLVLSRDLRTYCISHISKVFGSLDFKNSHDDVVDRRIPNRYNGLMMAADFKPAREKRNADCGGRYCVRVTGSLCGTEIKKDVLSEARFLNEFEQNIEAFYGFIFDPPEEAWIDPNPPKVKKPKVPKPQPQPQEEEKRPPAEVTFNLPEFLRVTAGWVPQNEDYVQLCMYFETQGLDPSETNRLCNQAWCYSSDETARMIKKYNGSQVTRASVARLLYQHATLPWDDKTIFPGRLYKFHNEASIFDDCGRIWNDLEVERFFTDVYAFTWGGGDTEFVYQEKKTKRFGRKFYTAINTIISPDLPFGKHKNDKLILLKPTMADLKKELKKALKQKPDKKASLEEQLEQKKRLKLGRKLMKAPETTELYEAITRFLKDDVPDPKEFSLGGLFILSKQRHGAKFRQYHSYCVEPYLWKDEAIASTSSRGSR